MTCFIGFRVVAVLAAWAWLPGASASEEDSGAAETLTSETLDEYLAKKQEGQRLALVMFHVSWCKVCQKTFPKFSAAAGLVLEKEIPMDFAHVDCTSDKTLCKRFDVKGYPTIKLFSHKEGVEPLAFKSQRSEESFVRYAQRMTLPAVRQMASAAELETLLRNETFSAFLAAAPDAASVPAGLVQAADLWRDRHIFVVAPKLQDLLPKSISAPAGATLAVLSMGAQQWPGVDNTTEAGPVALFYEGDLSDAAAVGDWVEKHRFPGIWSLGESNFYAFTHASRRTAMIAVDPEEVSIEDEERVRGTAGRLKADYIFGVLDGVSWHQELGDFNIARPDLPRVLVTEDDFEAWFEDLEGLRLDTLEEDLAGIASGEKQLLRQGRSVLAKLFFYKRETWRYMVMLKEYSERGVKESLLALCMVIAGTFAVMTAGWCMMTCCSIMLTEDDMDYVPPPKGQARHTKKE